MKKITLLMLLFVLQLNAQVTYYTFNHETGGTLTSSGTNLGYQGNYYASNSNSTYSINLPFILMEILIPLFWLVLMDLLKWAVVKLMEHKS